MKWGGGGKIFQGRGKPTKYLYIEYHSVWLLVEIGTPPPLHPLSRKRVCPAPVTKGGGGAHSAADLFTFHSLISAYM
jgi:hypothetical protein